MKKQLRDAAVGMGYFFKRHLKGGLRKLGFDFVRYHPVKPDELASVMDLSENEREIIARARPFTMTSVERMAALISAVKHITHHGIRGDIAECGVWRGGSMMVVALTLLACNDRSRSLYLFDTFEGMSPPTSDDKSLDGVSAQKQLDQEVRGHGVWCGAGLDDVRANLLSTGYPADKMHFIKGKVEDTLPQPDMGGLSLLRLDTDWYESTRRELLHLFPLLAPSGVLIIDDYGHWQGAKKAVDEYFAHSGAQTFLHRIDYTGRMLIKPAS